MTLLLAVDAVVTILGNEPEIDIGKVRIMEFQWTCHIIEDGKALITYDDVNAGLLP